MGLKAYLIGLAVIVLILSGCAQLGISPETDTLPGTGTQPTTPPPAAPPSQPPSQPPSEPPAQPPAQPTEEPPAESTASVMEVFIGQIPTSVPEYEAFDVVFSQIEFFESSTETWHTVLDAPVTRGAFAKDVGKEQIASTKLPISDYSKIRITLDSATLFEAGEEEPVDFETNVFELEFHVSVHPDEPNQAVVFIDAYDVQVDGNAYPFVGEPDVFFLEEFDEHATAIIKERTEVEEMMAETRIEELVYPTSVEDGSTIAISWKVTGEAGTEIPHTAIHYDLEGGKPADISAYALVSTILDGAIPGAFSTSLAYDQGTEALFFRAHVITNGEHTYTDEFQIDITPAPEPEPETVELATSGDDSSFVPSALSAPAGATVMLTLSVPTTNVSFGGQDFRSDLFNPPKVKPGESTVVEFTMPEESFTVKSYWPGTNNLKATLTISPS